MGKIGNATGYPALRVTTGSASEVAEWADKDLLVLGNPGNQPLFTQWAARIVWLQWNLSRNPFLLGGLVVLVAMLGASAAFASLQMRARKRLK